MNFIAYILICCLISANAFAGVLIEQFGDSTTAGLTFHEGKIQVAKRSSADIIYLNINNRFGPIVSVANKGLSGTCAINLIAGDEKTPPWSERVKKSRANIITFSYGLNDYIACHRSAEQFAEDLAKLVDITTSVGKLPILIEPNPATTPDRKDLAIRVGAMNLVAEQRKIPIVQHYKLWTQLPNYQTLLSDGVHPTEQGYLIKGITEYQALSPIIISLLRKQQKELHQ